jgi:glycosyltransferase involved in cell wall biosynthesis
MEIKRSCHLHLVALRYGLGLNTVESAALGIVPLVQIPNFVRFLIPGCPIVNVTADSLYRTVKSLIAEKHRLKDLGLECREWIRQQYDARRIVESYWFLYDFIYHSFSVDYPELF